MLLLLLLLVHPYNILQQVGACLNFRYTAVEPECPCECIGRSCTTVCRAIHQELILNLDIHSCDHGFNEILRVFSIMNNQGITRLPVSHQKERTFSIHTLPPRKLYIQVELYHVTCREQDAFNIRIHRLSKRHEARFRRYGLFSNTR